MKTIVNITSKIVKTREIEESFSDEDSQVFYNINDFYSININNKIDENLNEEEAEKEFQNTLKKAIFLHVNLKR